MEKKERRWVEGVEGNIGLDGRGVFTLVRRRGAIAMSCCRENVYRNVLWSIKMWFHVLFGIIINGQSPVKRRKSNINTAQNKF